MLCHTVKGTGDTLSCKTILLYYTNLCIRKEKKKTCHLTLKAIPYKIRTSTYYLCLVMRIGILVLYALYLYVYDY